MWILYITVSGQFSSIYFYKDALRNGVDKVHCNMIIILLLCDDGFFMLSGNDSFDLCVVPVTTTTVTMCVTRSLPYSCDHTHNVCHQELTLFM